MDTWDSSHHHSGLEAPGVCGLRVPEHADFFRNGAVSANTHQNGDTNHSEDGGLVNFGKVKRLGGGVAETGFETHFNGVSNAVQ